MEITGGLVYRLDEEKRKLKCIEKEKKIQSMFLDLRRMHF